MRVRELAEVSRPETLPISGSAFSAETAAVVRARLGGAIPEMIEAIARGVPDYARRARPDYQQRLTDAVTGAVAHFIAPVARPDEPARAITAEFRTIGGTAAREGRTLDALQDALRLGARVAWRWLCEADAGLDRRELSRVGEAIFAYLDELAAACAQGYAEARVQAAGDRQRRLLAAIVSDPPPRAELVASLAEAAGWVLPAQVAMVILGERRQDAFPLPPGVLADWTGPEPCLLVPDPDGPGRQAAIDRALSDRALRGRRAVRTPPGAAGAAAARPARPDRRDAADLAAARRERRRGRAADPRPPADGQVPDAADSRAVRRPVARSGPPVRAAAGAADPYPGRPPRALAQAGHLIKAGHPSDRRRRWPTEGDRYRRGLDSFASAAPQRQAQRTGSLCRPSGVRVVVVWRPQHG